MEIFVFIVISSIGLFTTRTLLKIVSKMESFTHHKYALTLAFGLSLTYLFSFIAPVAVAQNFKVDIGLFLFIIATSLLVWAMTYAISRFLNAFNEKHRDYK